MREPPAGRDRREIVVPGEMRGGARGSSRGELSTPRRARKAAGGPGAAGAVAAFARQAGRFCLRYPGGVLGTVAGLGAALAVCLNAVGFQEGRHPAPILPTVERAAEPKPESKPDFKSLAARPTPIREVRAEAPAEAQKPAPAPQRDAIAEMIRSGETTASVTPKPAVRTKPDAPKPDAAKTESLKADPGVARAQRALSRLGYGPLKDDGLMGPGTRAAIERFERDRKLPVKGEAAGRTLRELTAKAAQG